MIKLNCTFQLEAGYIIAGIVERGMSLSNELLVNQKVQVLLV